MSAPAPFKAHLLQDHLEAITYYVQLCQGLIPKEETPIVHTPTDGLSPPYEFLKSRLLRKEEIGRIKPKELYEQHILFCKKEGIAPLNYYPFLAEMREIGIESVKKNGESSYTITLDQLQVIATTHKWLEETKEEEEETFLVSKKEYDEFLAWKASQTKAPEVKAEEVPKNLVKKVIKKVVKKKAIEEPKITEEPDLILELLK